VGTPVLKSLRLRRLFSCPLFGCEPARNPTKTPHTILSVKSKHPPAGGIVGIDMGIARFSTLSDGSSLEPLHTCLKDWRA